MAVAMIGQAMNRSVHWFSPPMQIFFDMRADLEKMHEVLRMNIIKFHKCMEECDVYKENYSLSGRE